MRKNWNTLKYISVSPCPVIWNQNIYSKGSVLSGGKWKEEGYRSRTFCLFCQRHHLHYTRFIIKNIGRQLYESWPWLWERQETQQWRTTKGGGIWNSTYPPNDFSKNVPKLPRQDTQQFNNWSWKIQANRKVIHLEVDKGETKFIEKPIEFAKEKKYFEEMWGKQVHVSKVVGKDTSAV